MTPAERDAWFRDFPAATEEERATFAQGGTLAELAAVASYARRNRIAEGPSLLYFRWLAAPLEVLSDWLLQHGAPVASLAVRGGHPPPPGLLEVVAETSREGYGLAARCGYRGQPPAQDMREEEFNLDERINKRYADHKLNEGLRRAGFRLVDP